jgi:DNA-binding transcriptional ArsR family regulator
MSELTGKIASFLKVLSDQTRLDILELLKNGEKNSREIQETLKKSQSTISQHLKKLSDEDLITYEEKENLKYYNIKYQYIFKILTFIQSFVITLQKEKVRKLSELNIQDTLS